MTATQSHSLDMYDTIVEYVESTNAISNTRPGLITGKNNLKTAIKNINEKVALQSTQNKGVSEDKDVLKGELALAMFTVTSGTSGFAATTGNNTLKGQMDYSISELQKIKDETIGSVATNIDTIVTPFIGAPLAEFGVDAGSLTAMLAARDIYLEAKSKPREAVVEKKIQTDALKPLFVAATGICHDVMDKAANTLSATQKDWFSGYHNARRIISTGTRHTTAEGDCLEEGTSTPIYNATVVLSSIGKEDITLKTDLHGHWKKIPIEHGVWAFTATHPDYEDFHVAAYEIKLGQSVIKTSMMVKKMPV